MITKQDIQEYLKEHKFDSEERRAFFFNEEPDLYMAFSMFCDGIIAKGETIPRKTAYALICDYFFITFWLLRKHNE